MATKKAVKKASRSSRSTRKKSNVVENTLSTPSESTTQQTITRVANSPMRRYLIIGLVVIILAALLYLNRGLFVVGMVNGQPISRLAYINEMENQVGQQAFNTIVTRTLITQEARKKNVQVTEKEVDDEIKKIEYSLTKQRQKLDDVLALQGTTRESLEEQLRYQKLLEKLVGSDIKVSDKDIDTYLEQNKDFYAGQENVDRNTVKEQLVRERLNEKISTYVNDLNKKAKIDSYIE